MLHHLLTHTSGLRDQDLDEHALAKLRSGEIAPGEPSPLDVFPGYRHFGAVHDAPLWKPPGAEMAYSSSYNYGLLAEVVRRVTGQPPDQFAQERVLGPLGMASTSYTGVPPERIGRVVRRSADSPLAFLDRPDLLARVPGPAGAYSTALDLAQLVQMFLDGGSPSRGLLSPAAAAEMTRNQIPGVRAVYRDEVFPEASWGYGWGIQGNKRSLRQPALLSLAAFSHGGAGGSFMWGDPTYDLVGVYLSVVDATYPSGMEKWAVDLFADAATTAVLDR
jgi:CubicO group peptidase (beta-lactamase class C family)